MFGDVMRVLGLDRVGWTEGGPVMTWFLGGQQGFMAFSPV